MLQRNRLPLSSGLVFGALPVSGQSEVDKEISCSKGYERRKSQPISVVAALV